MTRRDYGSGSIYYRAATDRWVGTVEAGWTPKGKRRRITITAKTEAEAKRKLRDRIKELEADGPVGANPRTTVKAWADEWLAVTERTLAPHTYTANRSAVRQWIVPTIGRARLTDLAPADVRKVADAMRTARKATSSIARVHSVLIKMLKDARAEGHGVPARVVEVKAPKSNASDRTDIPPADAVKILRAAANLPTGARWIAALLQGMRQGECLGLTWEQVDLERRVLLLSWQLQPIPYRVPRDRTSGFRAPDGYDCRQVKGRMHLVRPKSRAGWRLIPLIEPMVAALEARREAAPDGPAGLVWFDGDGPIDQKADDAEWYALQDAAGVRHPSGRHYTVHEARHSTASLLHAGGVAPETITAIIGHSSWASTRTYIHVDPEPMRKALEGVAATLQLSPPSDG